MGKPPSRRLLLIEGKEGAEIKQISVDRSNWTAEQWEEEVAALEVPLAESQLDPRDYDRLAEEQTASIFTLADNEASERLQFLIELHINALSPREREVKLGLGLALGSAFGFMCGFDAELLKWLRPFPKSIPAVQIDAIAVLLKAATSFSGALIFVGFIGFCRFVQRQLSELHHRMLKEELNQINSNPQYSRKISVRRYLEKLIEVFRKDCVKDLIMEREASEDWLKHLHRQVAAETPFWDWVKAELQRKSRGTGPRAKVFRKIVREGERE